MAVNIIGQNIQLLLNQAQGADISRGLQAGEVIQARLLEVLPDNRGIIQLKGMNLLAALPPAQAGQIFQKGALLDLAVLQITPSATTPSSPAQAGNQAKVSGSGATVPQTPVLSLKLLGISTNNTAPLPLAVAPQASQAALARPSLEVFLIQAQMPVNSTNLQAAESLNRHGLPLDKPTLNSVVQTVEAMIDVESAFNFRNASVAVQSSVQTPPSTPLQISINNVKDLLASLVKQPGRSGDSPIIQKLLQRLDNLDAVPGLPLSAQGKSAAASLLRIEAAAALAESQPQALQQLETALDSLEIALQTTGATPNSVRPAPVLNFQAAKIQDFPQATSSPLNPSIKRELVTAVIRSLVHDLKPQVPLRQQTILEKIDAFSLQVAQPEDTIADQIIASAKNQLPVTEASAEAPIPKSSVLQALAQVRAAFVEEPLANPLKSEAALVRAFDARGLGPAPQIALDALPRETVLEAVAFLKARGLAPARPLVETIAVELGKTTDLGANIQNIVDAEPQIPQTVLDMLPDLKQAFDELKQFLSDNGIQPENKDVWAQIKNFVSKSGLNLENSLAKMSSQSKQDTGSPNRLPNPENSLKAILLKLNAAVEHSSNQPVARASAEVAGRLEHLSGQINSAINTMHALTLSARPTPAFDVTTVQLPVFIGGQMQSGQLSVYWKRGRPHELSTQDPVNVVFLLNTRGLGEVKVQLQVWKSECQCRVTVSSDATRDFIKTDSGELKASFEKNTSFKLNSMDVSTQAALGNALSLGLNQLPTAIEGPRLNGGLSLNLTA